MRNTFTLLGFALILAFITTGKIMSAQTSGKTELAGKLKKAVADSAFILKEDPNGNVYVSVDGAMLFNPGSTLVNEQGEKILKPLIKLFYDAEENFSIMIKTTDSEELIPAKLVDNWALSQARATTIMRIFVEQAKEMDQKAIAKKSKQAKEQTVNEAAEDAAQNTEQPEQNGKKYVLVLVDSL